MAIVKANYVKRGKIEKERAKATIRYIQHRPGREGEKTIRTLFGSDGVMERKEAYRMIDEALKATTFFRFVISPDPTQEDKQGDLALRDVTQRTMQLLDEHLRTRCVGWCRARRPQPEPARARGRLRSGPDRQSRPADTHPRGNRGVLRAAPRARSSTGA